MTDSLSLRAMANQAWNSALANRGVYVASKTPLGGAVLAARDVAIETLLTSWANEKAEMERQLELMRDIVQCARDWCRQVDEVGTGWDDWDSQYKYMHWTLLPLLDEALARHASLPLAAKS